ncbi:NAD(+) diphosphatase [Levilactobacillus yiduensis]|uniref:NAD(+) diphosphatase n=1 Tax=Levilactobacillus yiduensis TaxID=2953880 RepID=UPI000EF2BA6C|nr:NAD(+) diphosphatase [Levilactobacillus yiduensis]AYM03284.1 NAD(+) diphosphatase [Levilactobacillus brevis]
MNQFDQQRAPRPTDVVFSYHDGQILVVDQQTIPRVSDLTQWGFATSQLIYLFTIDETAYYLTLETVAPTTRRQYQPVNTLRHLQPQSLAFASATAAHLGHWYASNQFCGRCGHRLTASDTARKLVCDNCGNQLFPTISSAIIVGVTHGEQLLLTKFLMGYDRYALLSGYVEIGEMLADTVRREVHEEVGLSVHNIRYYGSQPWGFSGSLLVGFFADLDQVHAIDLEEDELAQAKWFDRHAIPHDDTTTSLSWQMIEAFRRGDA